MTHILILHEKNCPRVIKADDIEKTSKKIVEARLRHGWYRENERPARKAIKEEKCFEYLQSRKNEQYESFSISKLEDIYS